MKRSKPTEKLAQKRQSWIRRTALALNISEEDAEQLLRTPRQQSVRINTLKTAPVDNGRPRIISKPEALGRPFAWMPAGYELTCPVADIRDNKAVVSGEVFIQNAASWLPVLALAPQSGDYILDVCAAPGGKTSHIAAITGNQAHITANDNSRPRLAKLHANLDRLDAHVERFTLYDATAIARKLEGEQFDSILIDAPCSGEGLMHLDNDKDFATWSVAHIKRLQRLQKRIIAQAWQLLKPGGILVYSTCTMAPEENEAVVDYLLRSHDNATILPFKITGLPNRVPAVQSWNGKDFDSALQHCMRLKPSEQIEAFFVCKLQKTGQTEQILLYS